MAWNLSNLARVARRAVPASKSIISTSLPASSALLPPLARFPVQPDHSISFAERFGASRRHLSTTARQGILQPERGKPGPVASLFFMAEPAGFGLPDPETMKDNSYQNPVPPETAAANNVQARIEFNTLLTKLKEKGVVCAVLKGNPECPDAVFPNNWFVYKAGKDGKPRVILCPMKSTTRQKERDVDFMNALTELVGKENVLDLRRHEKEGRYLEGTGAMVFDESNVDKKTGKKNVFISASQRVDEELARKAAEFLGYEPVFFKAHDQNGNPIYHTNVLMWIGEKSVGICADYIKDPAAREHVLQALQKDGRSVILLSDEQIKKLAGNMFEVNNIKGEPILAMSTSAWKSLDTSQQSTLKGCYGDNMVIAPLDLIQHIGGGGVRCTIAMGDVGTDSLNKALHHLQERCPESFVDGSLREAIEAANPPIYVMTRPTHFQISPTEHNGQSTLGSVKFDKDPDAYKKLVMQQWTDLKEKLIELGARVVEVEPTTTHEDAVYAQDAFGVKIDYIKKRIYVGVNNFAHPDRKGEEGVLNLLPELFASLPGLRKLGGNNTHMLLQNWLNGDLVLTPTHLDHASVPLSDDELKKWLPRGTLPSDVLRVEVITLSPDLQTEGGDRISLTTAKGEQLWVGGYGPRTSGAHVHEILGEKKGITIMPVELANNDTFHVDTCMLGLPNGGMVVYEKAFVNKGEVDAVKTAMFGSEGAHDERYINISKFVAAKANELPAEQQEYIAQAMARQYICNGVSVGKNVIIPEFSPELAKEWLEHDKAIAGAPEWLKESGDGLLGIIKDTHAALVWRIKETGGIEVHEQDLSALVRSGGAANCVTKQANKLIQNTSAVQLVEANQERGGRFS